MFRPLLQPLEDHLILGNPPLAWATAALIALASFIILRFGLALLSSRLRRAAQRRSIRILRLVQSILDSVLLIFLIAASLWIGILTLDLTPRADRIARGVFVVFAAIQAAAIGRSALRFSTDAYVQRRITREGAGSAADEEASLRTMMGAVNVLGVIALDLLLVLLVLQNLGIEVLPLVTGLGITGVAVALAVQNILSDLFASLSIVLDQPFAVGDFIVAGGGGGDDMGTVERIGLKSTRLRSLSGEQLVFSNADLLRSRIRNLKRMSERRIVFTFQLAYAAAPDRLRAVPDLVRQAVETVPTARFDRATLTRLGPSAIEYEAVYFLPTGSYHAYTDALSQIHLTLLDRLSASAIQLAGAPTPTPTPAQGQVARP